MLPRLRGWRGLSSSRLPNVAASELSRTEGGAAKVKASDPKASSHKRDLSGRMRLNMADRVLMERKVTRIGQISHTAEERVIKQLSTRTMHRILPLSKNDGSGDQVRLLSRQMLLEQRRRATASWVDRFGVPTLTPVNGLSHFVLPLQRVLFTYCSHARDSDGVREFLGRELPTLAQEHPGIEFVVEPRWSRLPLIRGFFLRGIQKVLCLKNFTSAQVREAFFKLRNSSGQPLRPFHQQVLSKAPAVRPIWSPFHMLVEGKNDPLARYKSNSNSNSNGGGGVAGAIINTLRCEVKTK